jgi:hypothetical protein
MTDRSTTSVPQLLDSQSRQRPAWESDPLATVRYKSYSKTIRNSLI